MWIDQIVDFLPLEKLTYDLHKKQSKFQIAESTMSFPSNPAIAVCIFIYFIVFIIYILFVSVCLSGLL